MRPRGEITDERHRVARRRRQRLGRLDDEGLPILPVPLPRDRRRDLHGARIGRLADARFVDDRLVEMDLDGLAGVDRALRGERDDLEIGMMRVAAATGDEQERGETALHARSCCSANACDEHQPVSLVGGARGSVDTRPCR